MIASLNRISEWCEQWQMSINVKKSAVIAVTRKKENSHFAYAINDTALTKVNKHKYLGVTIIADLKWNFALTKLLQQHCVNYFFLNDAQKVGGLQDIRSPGIRAFLPSHSDSKTGSGAKKSHKMYA